MSDLRRHEARTQRNLVLGFFGLMVVVGGGLILWIYGPLALGTGLVCMIGGAMLFGLVTLVTLGFGWLSAWLDHRAGLD